MDFPKSVPNIGLVGGRFVDENTGTGVPGSLIPSVWGNSVTLEILSVYAAAGVIPDELKTNQLAVAIAAIVSAGATWAKIAEKPTTIAGFGLTDAVSSAPTVVNGKVGDLPVTQFYTMAEGTIDKPAMVNYGSGLHIKYPLAKLAFDLVAGITSEWYGVRRVLEDGTGVWRTLWHDANFNPGTKANLAGPAFSGVPTAPTAAAESNTQQLANTAFTWTAINTYATTVTSSLSLKANLVSPAFTGVPTAPTATAGSNTQQLATTAFTWTAINTYATTVTSALALKADAAAVTNALALKADTATIVKGVGDGQAWQNLTASRVAGTTYTNSTGRPIVVSCYADPAAANILNIMVSGLVIAQNTVNNATSGANSTVSAVVPPGATYSVTRSLSTIGLWAELR